MARRYPTLLSPSSSSVLESLATGEDSQLSFRSAQSSPPTSNSKVLNISLSGAKKKKKRRLKQQCSPLEVVATKNARHAKPAARRVAHTSRASAIVEGGSHEDEDESIDIESTPKCRLEKRSARKEETQKGLSSSSSESSSADEENTKSPPISRRKPRQDPSLFKLPAGDASDDGALETPYAQAFDRASTRRRRPVEPLRAGDVVSYYHPAFVAGNPMGFRIAQVVRIQSGHVPLLLSNMECLSTDCYVRRIQEYKKGQLVPHEGLGRAIEDFNYTVGDELREDKRAFEDRLSEIRRVLQEGREAVQQGLPPSGDSSSDSPSSGSDSDNDRTQIRRTSTSTNSASLCRTGTVRSKNRTSFSPPAENAIGRRTSSIQGPKRKFKAGKQKKSSPTVFSSDSDSSVDTPAQLTQRSRESSTRNKGKQTRTKLRRLPSYTSTKSSAKPTGALVDSDSSSVASKKSPRNSAKTVVPAKKRISQHQASSRIRATPPLRKGTEMNDSDDSDDIPASVLSSRYKATSASASSRARGDSDDGGVPPGISVPKNKKSSSSVSTLASATNATTRTEPNHENLVNGTSFTRKKKSLDPRKAEARPYPKKKKRRQFCDEESPPVDMDDLESVKEARHKELRQLKLSSISFQRQRKGGKGRLDSSSMSPSRPAAGSPEDSLCGLPDKAPFPGSPPIARKKRKNSASNSVDPSSSTSLIQRQMLQQTCESRTSFTHSETRQWSNHPNRRPHSQRPYEGCSQESISTFNSASRKEQRHVQPTHPNHHQRRPPQQSRRSPLELDFQTSNRHGRY